MVSWCCQMLPEPGIKAFFFSSSILLFLKAFYRFMCLSIESWLVEVFLGFLRFWPGLLIRGLNEHSFMSFFSFRCRSIRMSTFCSTSSLIFWRRAWARWACLFGIFSKPLNSLICGLKVHALENYRFCCSSYFFRFSFFLCWMSLWSSWSLLHLADATDGFLPGNMAVESHPASLSAG